MKIRIIFFKFLCLFKSFGNKSVLDKSRSVLKTLFSIFGSDAVFYINGAEVLPAPLEIEEEAKALSYLKSSDPKTVNDAKGLLITKNLRLVVYIAKRFENTGIGIEDLISIGTLGLMKAINTFDPDKNIKLATYASRCIENEILMFIRKNAKTRSDISLEEPLNVDWDGNELLISDILGTDEDEIHKHIEKEEERSVLLAAVEKLGKRDKTIIKLRFGLDSDNGENSEMTQKEVADLLGISQSYISRLEKKIIASLKKDIIGFYR